jgi:Zn finger protein HypA/HybF involved in hydrogenase expression
MSLPGIKTLRLAAYTLTSAEVHRGCPLDVEDEPASALCWHCNVVVELLSPETGGMRP